MKRFAFSLERAMDWRRAQARLEQSKLERLFAELAAIDARRKALREEAAESERRLCSGPEASGFELAALDTFRRYAFLEQSRLMQRRADCEKRIAAQMQTIAAKRRDVRLLELARERRYHRWQAEAEREIDRQAEEIYLAKWKR